MSEKRSYLSFRRQPESAPLLILSILIFRIPDFAGWRRVFR